MTRAFLPVLLILCGLTAFVPRSAGAQDNPYAESYLRMLTERGIATDAAGLRVFLASHVPGPEDTARLAENLADLGHEDYAKREAAMQALLARPPRSLAEVELRAASDDPEVRWRAKLVLDTLRQPGNDLLYASLIVIPLRKVQGLADVVLGVAPLCQSDSMQLAMSRALVATATEADAPLLKKSLGHEDPRIRMACLNALATTLGEAAVADILPLLDDRNDLVRLDAATQLLQFRRGESLRTLGKLLVSEQLTVRNRSIHKLRSTLKVSLPYSGYEPAEDRALHAAEWQKSIEANLDAKAEPVTSTAAPQFVAHLALQSPRYRTLILIGKDGAIEKKQVAQPGGRSVAVGNGNLLSVHPSSAVVTETDHSDKTVWVSKALDERPIVAIRRKDGNTLVATMEGSLIELNASGNMIRKSEIGIVQDIEALENGNVLLLSFVESKLKQLDATGRVQWQVSLPAPPTSMCLAKDGHAVITLQGAKQLADVDLATQALKTLSAPFRSPMQVEQLEDGRLAIMDVVGAHLADRQGALIETINLLPVSPDGF
ncbi:HEAT repeat domain-containing protein [Caulifigura coniformis]|nr:HEAT repeat domain-containing protein [Caulifigura coniformis]